MNGNARSCAVVERLRVSLKRLFPDATPCSAKNLKKNSFFSWRLYFYLLLMH
jgi:hypothetical protein